LFWPFELSCVSEAFQTVVWGFKMHKEKI